LYSYSCPAVICGGLRANSLLKLSKISSKGGKMKFFNRQILRDQKGQGVMEYVIISSLVGIVCITAVKGFGDVVKKRVEDMKRSIVENIKT
jgi:Flp pilus assembly pilin Flp